MKKLFMALTVLATFTLAACGNRVAQTQFERSEFLMGTFARVRIHTSVDGAVDGEAVLDEVFDLIEHFERTLTVNDKDPDTESEVQAINQQAGIAPVAVSELTFSLIQEAVAYTNASDGVFNAAIGPLVKLWDINFEGARRPEREEIEAVLPMLDYGRIALNEEERTVFLKDEGMRLDLGGIAKGFMADQVAELLEDRGIVSALIDMGGDLYLLGSNPQGNPWDVGIQNPAARRSEGSNNLVGRLPITNQAVVTSGVYERYVVVDGVSYHHILNSETGFPFETGLVSVSVVSERAVDGEGFTTILFGMGLADGLAYVESLDGIEAIFITDSHEVALSSGLREIFDITNEDFTLKD